MSEGQIKLLDNLSTPYQDGVDSLAEKCRVQFFIEFAVRITKLVESVLRENKGCLEDRVHISVPSLRCLANDVEKLGRTQCQAHWPKEQFGGHPRDFPADHRCLDDCIAESIKVAPSLASELRRQFDSSLQFAISFSESDQAARERFLRRLRESVDWCQPRIRSEHSKTCLRSVQFRNLLGFERDAIEVWGVRLMIERVAQQRSRLFAELVEETGRQERTSTPGRILVHYIGFSNSNGLSESESDGFLDFNDTPPWDTWVDVVRADGTDTDLLVSWVPAQFEQSVQHGIDVECCEMLMWADSPKWNSMPERTMPLWLPEVATEVRAGKL